MKKFIAVITVVILGVSAASAQKSFFEYQNVGENIDSVYTSWKRTSDWYKYNVDMFQRIDQVLVTTVENNRITDQAYLIYNIYSRIIYRKILAINDHIMNFNDALQDFRSRIYVNSFLRPYYDKNVNIEQAVCSEDDRSDSFSLAFQMKDSSSTTYILEIVIEKRWSQYIGYYYRVYESYVDYALK